jgi:aminoglycoside phosphotransferase family enzyme
VLNHRLAPELYLDVVPIGGTPERPRIGSMPALEWAVRMKRFDESGRLDHLAARNELLPAQLTQLAETLCAFHGAADAAVPESRFGAPQQVLAAARENFVELRQLLPPSDQSPIEQLATWTESEFTRHAADFAARKNGGFIREGHGDLHLGNLVLIAGRVTALRLHRVQRGFPLERSGQRNRLRLDRPARPRPARACGMVPQRLAGSRRAISGAMAVFRFYAVYRAVVRAKVAALRAGQEDAKAARAELALPRLS